MAHQRGPGLYRGRTHGLGPPHIREHRVPETGERRQGRVKRKAGIAGRHEPVGQHPLLAVKHEGVRRAPRAQMLQEFGERLDTQRRGQHPLEAVVYVDGNLEGQDRRIEIGPVDRRRPDGILVRPAVAERRRRRPVPREVQRLDLRERFRPLGQQRLPVGADEGESADGGVGRHGAEEERGHLLRVFGIGLSGLQRPRHEAGLVARRFEQALDLPRQHPDSEIGPVPQQVHRVARRAIDGEAQHHEDRDRDQRAEAERQQPGEREPPAPSALPGGGVSRNRADVTRPCHSP